MAFLGVPSTHSTHHAVRTSLSKRNPLLLVRRKSDEADLDRLDADAAQHELAVDDVADTRVDDLAVAVERGDRIRCAAERTDVLVRERRRLRRRRRRWRRDDDFS